MPDEPFRIYWDANVPLSYINGVPERVPIIEELFRRARAGDAGLLTSALSRVEVAFGSAEKDAQALDAEAEQQIDTCGHPARPSRRLSSTT